MDFSILGQTLFLGFIIGMLFTAFKLPIPAPDTIAAITGIIGLYLGMLLIKYLGFRF